MDSEAVNMLFENWKYPENHKAKIRQWVADVVNGRTHHRAAQQGIRTEQRERVRGRRLQQLSRSDDARASGCERRVYAEPAEGGLLLHPHTGV